MKKRLIKLAVSGFLFAMMFLTACGTTESAAYIKGMEALRAEDYDTAMEEFQIAANQDGKLAEAYRGEGIVYLKRQDYEHAITLFGLSLDNMKYKDEDFREDVLYYQAEAYVGNEQLSEAMDLYDELIQESSSPAIAYFKRGLLYLQKEDLTAANADFAAALCEDQDYNMYIQIYNAFVQINMEADGADYLEEATKLTPDNAQDYYQQGRIYYYLEDYEKAREALGKATEKGSEEALLLQARICLNTGDTAAAREIYRSTLDKGTDDAMAYNGLALCDIAEENYESALNNIELGLGCNSDEENENLLFNEIVTYERMLDFQTAKVKMESFVAKYPQNREARREYLFLKTR